MQNAIFTILGLADFCRDGFTDCHLMSCTCDVHLNVHCIQMHILLNFKINMRHDCYEDDNKIAENFVFNTTFLSIEILNQV